MEIRLQVLAGHTSIFCENKHIFLLVTDTFADANLCSMLLRESQKYLQLIFLFKTKALSVGLLKSPDSPSLRIFAFSKLILYIIILIITPRKPLKLMQRFLAS